MRGRIVASKPACSMTTGMCYYSRACYLPLARPRDQVHMFGTISMCSLHGLASKRSTSKNHDYLTHRGAIACLLISCSIAAIFNALHIQCEMHQHLRKPLSTRYLLCVYAGHFRGVDRIVIKQAQTRFWSQEPTFPRASALPIGQS